MPEVDVGPDVDADAEDVDPDDVDVDAVAVADVDPDDGEPVVALSSDVPVVLLPPLEVNGSPASELLMLDSATPNTGLGLKQADNPRARAQTATLGRLDTPRQK